MFNILLIVEESELEKAQPPSYGMVGLPLKCGGSSRDIL